MNALEFLPFLGHSSIYPPFDNFLTINGITKRPSMKRNVEKEVTAQGHGLTMYFVFSSNAMDDGFVTKSEGTFIFKTIYLSIVEANKKDGKYKGLIPHGLQETDSREMVEKKLGVPKRRNAETDIYYLDELVWTIAFEGERLEFIELDLPDNGWRKHGICP